MWLKNVEIKDVDVVGFDEYKIEDTYHIVKRVTMSVDVVMLMHADTSDDPLDRVRKNMESEVRILKDPIIKAAYKI